MKRYPYNKSVIIKYEYEELRTPHTDAPTIYLFADLPSKTTAANGTGALQTVSSWSDAEQAFTKQFTLSAVSDPDLGTELDETFYLGINYRLQSGGTITTDIKPIVFSKTVGRTESHGVDIYQIKKVYPAISEYLNDSEIDDQIETALTEIKQSFNKKGVRYDKLAWTDELYLALAYKTLENALFNESVDINDIKLRKSEHFHDKYEDAMSGLVLPVVNSDGQVLEVLRTNKAFKIAVR